MAKRGGNSHIALSGTLSRGPMRPLAVLLALLLFTSPLLNILGGVTQDARADSVPSWNKIFHLHDGSSYGTGTYDWMNSSGPYNPLYSDYDGDGIPGITIKKNVTPQGRFHSWILYPPVNRNVVLSGDLSAFVWVYSFGNESGTRVMAEFFDITSAQFADPTLGTKIGEKVVGLSPYYNVPQLVELTVPSITYTLPGNHYLALVMHRDDSLNDWLIVQYDKSGFDSYVVVPASTFISMDNAWTRDISGTPRGIFTDLELVIVVGNVSNPFGAYDIRGANVTVLYAENGTTVENLNLLGMNLVQWDTSANPSWKLLEVTLPPLPMGSYILNVTSHDWQGYPSWLNITLDIVSVDHFGVTSPTWAEAGSPFSITITALNASNGTVTKWVGTVQLRAYQTDKVSWGNGTLSTTSVVFTSGDLGQRTISLSYDHSEELIYIRASSGSAVGWGPLMNITSGPVVSIEMVPAGPVEVTAGLPVDLNVSGRDSMSNINTTWTPYWSVSPNLGTVTSYGLAATFRATTYGVCNVTCTNNLTGAHYNITITINSGGLYKIEIVYPSSPIVIREAEYQNLSARGYDFFNNTVSIAGANWTTTTTGSLSGFGENATYRGGYVPETGTISVRFGPIVSSIGVTVLNGFYGPWLNQIPAQIRNEDVGTWELSLTGLWQDVNGTGTLSWWVEDVNTSLVFISHDPEVNSVVVFHTQPDQSGEDQFLLWVSDPTGFRTYQWVSVRIIAVNDKPKFVNLWTPLEIYVKFSTPYTFDWSYYVSDIDNTKSELSMASDNGNVTFDRLVATFIFPRGSSGSDYFSFVTIILMDLLDETGAKIVVKVTSDSPPDLNSTLPDRTINEGDMNVWAYDLDQYFFDNDSSTLYFTFGFENIVVFIDPATHDVYLSAPLEWSGVTEGTFKARDDKGAFKVDTVAITVLPVNDRPMVYPIQTIHVRYGVTAYLYLGPYVDDPDNSMESLAYTTNSSNVTHGISPTGSQRLELTFPANLSDPMAPFSDPYFVKVLFTVTDPLGLSNGTDFWVYVTDKWPPVIIATNPDELYYTFPEDTWLNNTLLLYDLFYDCDDTTLNFYIEGNFKLNFTVFHNGAVNLTAAENWSGMEILNITAVDSHGGWAFLQVYIVVTPVNDPPVLDPIKNRIEKGGPRNIHFSIIGYLHDEEDASNLTFIATPSANVQVVSGEIYISLPAGVDVITVTIQAYDGEYYSNRVEFKVGVSKTMAERIGWPYSFPLVLLAAGVAGYFVATRIPRPYALENLFLIHNDGRLVAHVSREENTTIDKDVLSAMFTAVQEFVRDSFQKGEVGLKKLEIGDKNVMIEKGRSAYLALIYSGWPQKETFDMLSMLLRDIEERYKARMEKWNGTSKTVAGVEKMLQDYMASAYKPGAWQEEAEIAEEEWVDILNKEA